VTNTSTRTPRDTLAKYLALSVLLSAAALGQNQSFHGAPASAKTDKNTYRGQNSSMGKAAFDHSCAACHGAMGDGSGNIPSLASGAAQGASDGELFWYITQGDVNNGMPSWKSLPEEQRWEIVNYIRVLGASKPGSRGYRFLPTTRLPSASTRPRRGPRSPITVSRSPARLVK